MYLLSNRALLGIYVRFQAGSICELKLMYFFSPKLWRWTFDRSSREENWVPIAVFKQNPKRFAGVCYFNSTTWTKPRGYLLVPTNKPFTPSTQSGFFSKQQIKTIIPIKKTQAKLHYVPILLMCMQFIWIEVYTFGAISFRKISPPLFEKKRLKCLIIQKHNTKTNTLLKLLKENRTNVLPDWRHFLSTLGYDAGLPTTCHPNTVRFPHGGMTGRLGLYPHGWWENHFHVKCSKFLPKNHCLPGAMFLISTIFESIRDVYGA